MKILTRLSELADFSCFKRGKKVQKKVEGGRVVSVGKNGKVSTRKQKGDPKVEYIGCPVNLLGVGMRKHPETVVEIGDGNILKRRRR
jgi:hypothetical protein